MSATAVAGVIYSLASQNLPTSAVAAFATYDTVQMDNYGMAALLAQPTRLTAVVAGVYLVGCRTTWVANSTGSRSVTIFRNGVQIVAYQAVQAAAAPKASIVECVGIVALNAGDYLQNQIEQQSGGALATVAASSVINALWAILIG